MPRLDVPGVLVIDLLADPDPAARLVALDLCMERGWCAAPVGAARAREATTICSYVLSRARWTMGHSYAACRPCPHGMLTNTSYVAGWAGSRVSSWRRGTKSSYATSTYSDLLTSSACVGKQAQP